MLHGNTLGLSSFSPVGYRVPRGLVGGVGESRRSDRFHASAANCHGERPPTARHHYQALTSTWSDLVSVSTRRTIFFSVGWESAAGHSPCLAPSLAAHLLWLPHDHGLHM